MAKSHSIKACSVIVELGEILLDGYELPPVDSGEYVCSKSQITSLLNLDARRLSELLELNLAKSIIPQGLTVIRVKATRRGYY